MTVTYNYIPKYLVIINRAHLDNLKFLNCRTDTMHYAKITIANFFKHLCINFMQRLQSLIKFHPSSPTSKELLISKESSCLFIHMCILYLSMLFQVYILTLTI